MPDPGANVGAVDEATHTLYASDEASAGALTVINTATCNAEDTSGCADHPPTMKIGAFPSPPVINSATQTVYVSYGTKANRVAVVNAATCNAEDSSGCAQTPGVVTVGKGTYVIAVSTKTDTIYAANNGASFSTGNTVSVINGAACDGTDHSGCGHLAATVKVGLGPYGVAVDDRTRTVYVANNAAGDLPGTVTVINAATCNGTDTAGCERHMPTVAVGHAPGLVAVDTSTDTVYVNDQTSAAVSVVNGSRCNAVTTRGCSRPAREQAVGSAPTGLSINQRTNTVYVTQVFQSGSLSIFGGARRRP
jgi:DNA-binding beta-propeller fold protein YncE